MKRYFYQALFFVCAALFGAVLSAHTVFATTTCNISSNTTIDATYVNTNTCDVIALTGTPTITWSGTIDADQPVLVQVNSGTVVFSGALVLGRAESSVTVASGATITHAAEDTGGIQITANAITVTGAISANSKGCRANYGPNLSSGVCAAATSGYGASYGGAGYGGAGGTGYFSGASAVYGAASSSQPTWLGSGSQAAAGGGRVTLSSAGTILVDGAISANGGTEASGGSVYIVAATLNGLGSIHANGGNGSDGNHGAGGGGRIAVYYDSTNLSVTDSAIIGALKGSGGMNSDAVNGSAYILDRRVDDGVGNLTFTGGGAFFQGGDFTRNSITVSSGSVLQCDTGLTSLRVSTTQAINWSTVTWTCSPTAATSFTFASESSITLSSLTATFAGSMGDAIISGTSLSTSAVTWSFSGASTLSFNVPGYTNTTASSFTMSKAGSYTTFGTTGALTLNNFTYTGGSPGTTSAHGGHLIFPSNIDLTFTNAKIYANVSSTLASLSLDSSSLISASGKGCQLAYGPAATNICTSATAGAGASYGGAGHGGVGGSGYYSGPGATYGSSTYPILFGSGAGGNATGVGGGRVYIVTTGSLTLGGPISANGSGTGGSGGSIYLLSNAFSGSGALTATGSNGDGNIGGGGGGRIAMISNLFTFSGTSSTSPGSFGGAAAGTIYKLEYVIPTTPSFSAPTSGIYNALRTPTLTASTYANSPYATHLNTDWKVTTDSGGSSTVWSSLTDATNLTTTVVDSSHGTFAGVLSGQSALAASSTYYAFVRYRNSVGPSSWSTATTFTTAYGGTSSTKTFDFSDTTSTDAFTYDSTYMQVNASSNGYARMKDLGSGTYGYNLAYPSTYTRVKKLTITNQVATVLTDFQAKVTVTYDADMQSDFDDIRFTSSDGVTDIPFWLESKTNGSSAIFYVKVPSLPASGTATVYMYYGDATVASGSSGTSTFLFFDDFNDGDISGWTSFAAESPAVAPLVTAAGNALRINGSASSNMEGGAVYGGYTFTNGIYEADVTLDTYALAGQETHMFARMSSIGTNPTGYRFGPLWAGSNDLNLARETGHANLANTSYTYGAGISRKMSFTLSGSTLKGSIDGTQYLTTTDANYSSGYLGFVIDARHESQAAMQSTIDNVRVRQYVATEPSVSTGSEVINIGFTAASIVSIDNGSLADYTHLYRMEETLMPGSTGSASYQLSANGTTWKYWDGSAWSTASASFTQANSSSTLNSYLPLFGAQVGSGRLYVRIVLSSDGTQPVGLDALTFYYLLSNVAPSVPASLGSSTLVDGSTTSTNTPVFSFDLADTDSVDTLKYQIQIDDASDFSSPAVDYTSALAAQGARTFQVGQAVGGGSYAVGAQDQTLSDGSYYWQVKTFDSGGLSSSYVTATTGTAAFVVDTATRTIQFASTTATGAESVGSITIPIALNQSHFVPVSVDYTVTAGTATAGLDCTIATGTATITAGQTSTTVSVTMTDDAIAEPTETFTLSLSSPTNASLGAGSDFVYTITDNDTAGVTVTQSSGSTVVVEGGATDTFTVVLTAQPTSTVQISFATTTSGVTLSSSLLSFDELNWSVPQTVIVSATDDQVYQGTHMGSITPSVALGGYGFSDLTLSSFTATITDNDVAGVTITGSLAVTEGGATDSFTVVLTSQPTSTVEITIATSTNGVRVSPAYLSFDDSTWSVPQTVTVTATNDDIAEGSHTGIITFSVVAMAYGYEGLNLDASTVAITDDDTAGVTITPSSGSVQVTEGGATDSFTIVLTSEPTSTIHLIVTTSTSDITLSTTTIAFSVANWSTPQTITVNAVNDLIAEGSQTSTLAFTVSQPAGTSYGYAEIVLSPLSVGITDNDEAEVILSKTTLVLSEAGDTDAYTVVLGSQPTSTVTVSLSSSDQVALSTSTILFTSSNWNTPVSVSVSAVDDLVAEGTHQASLEELISSSAHGYDQLTLTDINIIIEDNDRAGSAANTSGGGGGGGGGAAGSTLPISSLSPTPVPAQSPVKLPPPVIIVLPEPGEAPAPPPVLLPNQAVIAILNPSDVVSLVQATNGGRNIEAEGRNLTLIQKDAKEFAVPLKNTSALTLTNFITYGISDRTRALGEGERRALVRDALETMKTSVIVTTDLERLARGMVPEYRNLTVERQQLPRVRSTFKVLYGRDPNFKNAEENLAWNTLMYRIRFERNLTAEKKGIVSFQKTFKKKPEQPFQWATVRVMGYIQK